MNASINQLCLNKDISDPKKLENILMQKHESTLLRKISASFIFFLILMNGCSGTKPLSIGQFAKCPDKPNCISSKSSHSLHMFPSLTYQGTQLKAKNNLLRALESMPRAQVSMNTDKFLHIEYYSNINKEIHNFVKYSRNMNFFL